MTDDRLDQQPGPGAGNDSAPPDERGPGSGVAAEATALTGAAQTAANDVIDGLQRLSNHLFDAGEAGLEDALKIVDAAQTEVSKLLSTVTGLVAGKIKGT
jgi:hypothetical protein